MSFDRKFQTLFNGVKTNRFATWEPNALTDPGTILRFDKGTFSNHFNILSRLSDEELREFSTTTQATEDTTAFSGGVSKGRGAQAEGKAVGAGKASFSLKFAREGAFAYLVKGRQETQFEDIPKVLAIFAEKIASGDIEWEDNLFLVIGTTYATNGCSIWVCDNDDGTSRLEGAVEDALLDTPDKVLAASAGLDLNTKGYGLIKHETSTGPYSIYFQPMAFVEPGKSFRRQGLANWFKAQLRLGGKLEVEVKKIAPDSGKDHAYSLLFHATSAASSKKKFALVETREVEVYETDQHFLQTFLFPEEKTEDPGSNIERHSSETSGGAEQAEG